MSFLSASRITGTTRPFGVSAAKPRCTYFFRIRFCEPPSSELLTVGNSCSALTHARRMNASGVSLMPSFAALSLSLLRVSSSSVMSASSICQTCGTLSQLACRRGPEIFWMRPSGLTSTAPNFEKSTSGIFGRAAPPAPAAPPLLSVCLTQPFTSSAVIRPLRPEPFTRPRSTPSSRAKRRTDGLACAFENEASSIGADTRGAAGACAGAAAGAGAGVGAGAAVLVGAGAAAAAAGAAPPCCSTCRITEPFETRSPFFTARLFTTPAAVEGTSIVAFSVSSVSSGVSTAILSPGFTNTSMTSTSWKSPRSGTATSATPPEL